MAVKNINDQPVKSATYLWGVDNLGLACRVTPYVSPVLSVVGLTGAISQASLRTALGLGNAAYATIGTAAGNVAAGDHGHGTTYAALSHNHDSAYADIGHNHSGTYEPVLTAPGVNPEGKFLNGSKQFVPVPGYVTGVLSGCEFSAVTGGTTFTIAAGKLQYCNEYTTPGDTQVTSLVYAGASGVTDQFLSTTQTYIGVDSAGTIVQQITPFTNAQLRSIAQIGVLAKSANLIIAYAPLHNTAYNSPQFAGDLYRAIGPITSGLKYSGNAALTFARSSGTIFRSGAAYNSDKVNPHVVVLSSQPTVSFAAYSRNGDNVTFSSSGLLTTLNPSVYDDGGASTNGVPSGAVSTNNWQAFRLYVSTNGNTLLQYGQQTYNSIEAAQAGVASETFYAAPITNLVPFRGYLFVRGGAASLADSGDAVFVSASRFGETAIGSSGAASVFDGNLNADLNIIGTARRIKADMSNATLASRLYFQTSTVDGATMLGVIPNGTSVVAGTSVYNSADPGNASFGNLQCQADAVRVISSATGTGTQLPLVLRTNNTDRVSIGTDGNVDILGTGARIRGDFSNATAANMVAFQSNVLDGRTIISAFPNGVSKSAAYAVYNGTDPANAQRGVIGIDTTRVYTVSNYSGSPGVALPYDIDVGGVNRVRVLPTGEVGIGVTPAVGKGTLQVPDINGAATSGLKNAIVNGCRRISLRGNGAAVLGANRLGADGVVTFIGGWSSITGTQIFQEAGPNDPRFTSGALHYVALGTMTGASGFILFQDRIEAADSAQLGGKSITVSCKLMPWVTAPSNYYYRIYKANAKNDFTGTTLVAQSPSYGAMVLNTAVEQAYTFTLAAADSVNGLHIECVAEYTGAVGASSYLFQGDVQCKASSKLEPFELRPIALELALRRRYLRKQAVWVGTSTARTVIPIDMAKTPTITGGGSGFTSTGTTADTLMCYQTTAAVQTLILDAELT